MKVGFVGFGRMAKVIYLAIQEQLPETEVFAYVKPEKKAAVSAAYKIECLAYTDTRPFDLLFLCVKPSQIKTVAGQISLSKETPLVSVVVGLSIAQLTALFQTNMLIRTMPNTPAAIGEGMTVYAASKAVNPDAIACLETVLAATGVFRRVEEQQIDIVTGISGSGPAFFYAVAEAMAAEAASHGLAYDEAVRMVAQTMIGAGKMLANDPLSAQAMIDQVCSPNGTTSAGMTVLKTQKIDQKMRQVVATSIARAKEIGAASL